MGVLVAGEDPTNSEECNIPISGVTMPASHYLKSHQGEWQRNMKNGHKVHRTFAQQRPLEPK